MLVALQRTGEGRVLPPAVGHLVELLRSWGPGPDHLTGLALVGVSLPSRLGARFVDALVFTRSGVVVIAAHAPGPAEWPGPGDRTGAAVEAARGALAGHEGGRYVTGLVAVVPQAEAVEREGGPAEHQRSRQPAGSPGSWAEPAAESSGGRLEPSEPHGTAAPRSTHPEPAAPPPPSEPVPAFHRHEPAPVPGVAVVLADPRGLRRIISQHNRWRTVWSADDILDACYALSLAHLAPPRAALLADGFPARLPVRSRLPELPAVIPVPPEPPAPVADDEPWVPPVRGPGSAVFPRPRPIRQVPWGLVFVLTVLVAAGVVAAVFVAQVFHGS
ncbi:hypothetical protein [Amycolatopsis vancoresmycina]|uniref:NERD domain-containing protein n=1 Tax=Amycolatopsis vancoresmycina DSM 44592 TaxID=1292037 RepID=R1G195_9PSEU|nr:hypothetical protein [Amycolatopsis vancoresmycina]EOD65277.1 hypothetical protein H480_27531 [Amycolatopsis vancoresmycina DSM 44592]